MIIDNQIKAEPGTMYIFEPMPIDLQKFSGHTPSPWRFTYDPKQNSDLKNYRLDYLNHRHDGHSAIFTQAYEKTPDMILIENAPEILAEVIRLRKANEDKELQIQMLIQEVDELNECAGEELHQREVYRHAVSRYIDQVNQNGIFPKNCDDLEIAERALKNIVGLI